MYVFPASESPELRRTHWNLTAELMDARGGGMKNRQSEAEAGMLTFRPSYSEAETGGLLEHKSSKPAWATILAEKKKTKGMNKVSIISQIN